ncbi:hypothetical protein ACVBKF_29470, partial [Shewanella sp. 0m-11]
AGTSNTSSKVNASFFNLNMQHLPKRVGIRGEILRRDYTLHIWVGKWKIDTNSHLCVKKL